jgi:serine phosphatase RsbU (regulator of sigma subunit)
MEKYFLQVHDRSGKVSIHPISRLPFNIGRHPDNDLIIQDSSVSKQHAILRRSPEGLVVVDNDSLNGVFVNGEKIERKRSLRPGDMVSICSTRFKLKHAALPEITLVSKHSASTSYFPARGSWDPAQTLTLGLPQVLAPRKGEPAPSLQGLLRLLLDAPQPETYEQILNLVEETVPYERCYVILFDKDSPERINVVARRTHKNDHSEVIVSTGILRRVEETCEAVVVRADEGSYAPTDSFIRSGAQTAICIPLTAGGRVTGVVYLDRLSSAEPLAQKDIEALGPLAGIAALKIENLRLLDAQIAYEVNQRDMDLAKEIQEGLLPQDSISFPGFILDGYTCPCQQVGGDYFDFLTKENGSLTLVIGDVSGKGLPSALYMACVRSALHAHLEDGVDIRVLMSRLERHAQKAFRPDHFLTLFLGRLESQTGLLTYCNAGHLPPVVFKPNGDAFELEATEPALNVIPWNDFRCHEYGILPDELVLLYTDGLTEAENPGGEQFGVERLIAFVRERRRKDLPIIRKELLSEIDSFTGEEGPRDDRTLVLLRRSGGTTKN